MEQEMKEVIRFGDLEIGAKFEDNVGNTWMKTEQINWMGPDTRRYIRNAVVLKSANPELPRWRAQPGQMGDFHPSIRVEVISPNL